MNQSLEEYSWYRELADPSRQVVARAMQNIDNNYGNIDGGPINPYYYHNGSHTRMVCEDVRILRDALGLTPDEFRLAETAAAAHDVVKTFGRESGVDEQESADWLEQELESFPQMSRMNVLAGRLAIIGTIPRFEGGTIIQKAVEQDYPNKRAELIAHTVAGADVGRLFTPEGPLAAHQLFKEMEAVAGRQTDTLNNLLAFQDSQVEFLTNYKYPSRDIEIAMATHKAPVIRYLGQLSRMLEQGSLETWDELIGHDKDFIEANS